MDGILDVINSIKLGRRLSSEVEKLVKPFIGKIVEYSFSLIEEETTLSTRLGKSYKGGKTVLAKIANTELECSILFTKEKNDWINGLKKGSDFNCRVEVLQFDKLYDRIVLGEILANNGFEVSKLEPKVPLNLNEAGSSYESIEMDTKNTNSSDQDLKWTRGILLNLLAEKLHQKSQFSEAKCNDKKNEKPKENVSKVFGYGNDYDYIGKILTRSFWGVISMFLSFTGFMSENFIPCFIAFCIGVYLLYPLLKWCCNKDIRSKFYPIVAFLIFAISLSVEIVAVQYFLFSFSGYLFFLFLKKRFKENHARH